MSISKINYFDIFNNALIAIFLTKDDGTILKANKAACELFGYTEAELQRIGRHGIIDHDKPIVQEKLLERREKGFVRVELTGLKKDGTRFPIEIASTIFYNDSGEEFISTTMHDISERKKAEYEMTLMINHTEESFILLDTNFRIINFNKQLLELYQLYFKQAIKKGESIIDYAQPERRTIVKEIFERVLMGKIEKSEISVVDANGETKYFASKYSPSKNDQKEIIGIFITIRDITDERNAEKQNEYERRDKEALINTTNELIWSVNKSFKLKAANRAFINNIQKQTGILLKPGDNLLMHGVFPREFLDFWRKLYERCLSGISFKEEFYSPATATDQEIWSEIIFNPIYKQELVVGIACYARNITERKLAQQNIAQSELRYRTINEQATDAICIVDESVRFVEVNTAACILSGYTKEELLELSLIDILFEEDLLKNPFQFDQANKGITVRNERRLKRKDGQTRVLEVSTKLLGGGKFIIFGHDITERKKIEEQIRAAEERMSLIMNAALDAIICIDAKGMITFWNPQAEKIFGWNENEIMGKRLSSIIIPDDYSKRHDDGMTNYQKTGHGPALNVLLQLSAKKRSGEEFPIELTVLPIKQDGEEFFCGFIRDITERKNAELKLLHLNDHLQKQTKELAFSNQELEQFAYVISHDLQEPLRMISSFLTQFEKKYKNIIDEKGKTYIDFAVDGSKRMRQIILDLLEFARVGKLADKTETVDLNELLNEIQILFRKEIKDKQATIEVSRLPVLETFKSPLRQIFQNLIGNALKYTLANKPAHISIEVVETNDFWQFNISDNGIGIDKAYFDKIFVIFQRLHEKEAYTGTGLGLAVTKKIIENLGGRIWVESEEGEGSTFYFTLPKM